MNRADVARFTYLLLSILRDAEKRYDFFQRAFVDSGISPRIKQPCNEMHELEWIASINNVAVTFFDRLAVDRAVHDVLTDLMLGVLTSTTTTPQPDHVTSRELARFWSCQSNSNGDAPSYRECARIRVHLATCAPCREKSAPPPPPRERGRDGR
jgi:hypothetical protein